MSNREVAYWFPAKRFGYGWGIANTWQGGCVQIAYLLFMTFGTKFMIDRQLGRLWAVVAVVLTLVLVALHYWKGEPARWRWGND
jgi:hypothetical protein